MHFVTSAKNCKLIIHYELHKFPNTSAHNTILLSTVMQIFTTRSNATENDSRLDNAASASLGGKTERAF